MQLAVGRLGIVTEIDFKIIPQRLLTRSVVNQTFGEFINWTVDIQDRYKLALASGSEAAISEALSPVDMTQACIALSDRQQTHRALLRTQSWLRGCQCGSLHHCYLWCICWKICRRPLEVALCSCAFEPLMVIGCDAGVGKSISLIYVMVAQLFWFVPSNETFLITYNHSDTPRRFVGEQPPPPSASAVDMPVAALSSAGRRLTQGEQCARTLFV